MQQHGQNDRSFGRGGCRLAGSADASDRRNTLLDRVYGEPGLAAICGIAPAAGLASCMVKKYVREHAHQQARRGSAALPAVTGRRFRQQPCCGDPSSGRSDLLCGATRSWRRLPVWPPLWRDGRWLMGTPCGVRSDAPSATDPIAGKGHRRGSNHYWLHRFSPRVNLSGWQIRIPPWPGRVTAVSLCLPAIALVPIAAAAWYRNQ